MDKVNFHKADKIKKLVDHDLLFLPPYSTFLNPIENLFNQWKNLIKVCCSTTEEELFKNMETGSEKITSENCANYFRNMETYIAPCLKKEIILN